MRITRKFEFDAGHRVHGHQGKCRHLHGHRYSALVTIHSLNLNELGMVLDFGDIKTIIGGWIDANWDHNLILFWEDPLARMLKNTQTTLTPSQRDGICAGKEPYIMQCNPTAENMAAELYYKIKPLLPTILTIPSIELFETPNCSATYFSGEG